MFNSLREAIRADRSAGVLRREEIEAINGDGDMDLETVEIAAGFRLESIDNTMGLAEESEFDEMDDIADEVIGDVNMGVGMEDDEGVVDDDSDDVSGSDDGLTGDAEEGMEEVAEEIPGEGDEDGLDVEGIDVSDLMDLID